MADVAFDTLKMAQGLKDSGMENKQAESVVMLMNDVINKRIATRVDLEAMESVLRSDMEKLELRLTVKTFVMQASFTVALFAALKLFL